MILLHSKGLTCIEVEAIGTSVLKITGKLMSYEIKVKYFHLKVKKDLNTNESSTENIHNKRIIKGGGGDNCRNESLAGVARVEM